jgi:hypothetical protein
MDELRSGGRTVLFVSHNMAAIENLCPRTVWIDAGQLRMDGPSDDVIAKYLATFSESQRTGYDLEHAPNRGGTGAIRFTRVDFLDAQGQPTSVFRSGEPLRARFHYRVHELVRDPHFGVVIYSDMGTRVTTVSTWHAAYSIPSVTLGEGVVELVIDNLFLQAIIPVALHRFADNTSTSLTTALRSTSRTQRVRQPGRGLHRAGIGVCSRAERRASLEREWNADR